MSCSEPGSQLKAPHLLNIVENSHIIWKLSNRVDIFARIW